MITGPEGDSDYSEDVDMHVCLECDSDLVQQIGSQRIASELWAVQLSCPSCHNCSSGIFNTTQLDQSTQVAEAGSASLRSDLNKLVLAESEVFFEALAEDLILPEDFDQS